MADLNFIPITGYMKDVSGQQFGRLTAIGAIGRNKHRNILWLCICECGSESTTTVAHLLANHSTSCGCKQVEAIIATNLTHGLTDIDGYSSWKNMRSRIYNKDNLKYPRYGGRGITICSEWDDFGVFIRDMGKRPSAQHSIERRENDGNYCPENCSWELPIVQANNTMNNRFISHDSITLTMSQWSRKIGMNYGTLKWRLQQGWSDQDAITTPVNHRPINSL